jgi:hypothetical protein
VLRDQHERAMAAMNEMLSSTATDFQQTAQDMRITAQQVVKDIDTARSELKRAILDLPEETRSNADAMRKVVSDQIAALNALADVVKRQTGVMDLSGPGISLSRGYRDPSPGKAEGATVSSSTVSAPGKPKERNETLDALSNLRDKVLAELDATPEKPRAPAAREPAAPVREAVKEQPKPALSLTREMEGLVQKLNAAARDVVEAIDGSLPRDLERKYETGERDVYTRRLYDGRGKRLQRAIVEQYGKDRMIRSRVDAYVRLFERLLDMTSNSGRGEALVEACLASESGRVYVMLAAAAGRIPPQ